LMVEGGGLSEGWGLRVGTFSTRPVAAVGERSMTAEPSRQRAIFPMRDCEGSTISVLLLLRGAG